MKLVDRYILSSFSKVFLLALAAFTGIYLLVDFFERVDTLIEHQASALQYLLYFGNKIPLIIFQISPLAILLAVILSLGGLSRTNELTAMRAGGIGLWRISAPLLAFSLFSAAILLILSEIIVPLSVHKMNHVMEVEVKGRPEALSRKDDLWFREGRSLVHVALAVPEKEELKGVRIFYFDDEFRMRERIDAPTAVFSGGQWILQDATRREFTPETEELATVRQEPRLPLRLSRNPGEFQISESAEEELGFLQLRALARRLQQEGYDATTYRVNMHSHIATPFAMVIMAFLGIPFALQRGRGSTLALGVAISVGIGVLYHLISSMLLAFGYSGVLPPAVAAWSAHLIFLLFGIWLVLSSRQ